MESGRRRSRWGVLGGKARGEPLLGSQSGEEARGGLAARHKYPKGGSVAGSGVIASAKTRGSGLELCQGRFRWDDRQKFFAERVVGRWHRLPRKAVESPSLEVSKTQAAGVHSAGHRSSAPCISMPLNDNFSVAFYHTRLSQIHSDCKFCILHINTFNSTCPHLSPPANFFF